MIRHALDTQRIAVVLNLKPMRQSCFFSGEPEWGPTT